MTAPTSRAATFVGLVDLASASLGGEALATNDDFFAGMENLTKPDPAVFLPDEYTDRGKWMDGWESRRKRSNGQDWCILRLGQRGRIRGLDVDTAHFLGNHAPFASLEALSAPADTSIEALNAMAWTEVLPQSPLRPGSQNLFAVSDDAAYTHVRLTMYPDGGIARLRVFGDVLPDWDAPVASHGALDKLQREHAQDGEVDLASVYNGGLALACSDAFFGPMNNLISPGRAANMGGGWESRRRRGASYETLGCDWILLRLGVEGQVGLVEVDTNHFKGNFPDRFLLEGVKADRETRITDLLAAESSAHSGWQTLIEETSLGPHRRAFFREEIAARGPFTHVRLTIFPDGGISRLRIFGKPKS